MMLLCFNGSGGLRSCPELVDSAILEVQRSLDAGRKRALRVGKGPTCLAHVLPEHLLVTDLRLELEIALQLA